MHIWALQCNFYLNKYKPLCNSHSHTRVHHIRKAMKTSGPTWDLRKSRALPWIRRTFSTLHTLRLKCTTTTPPLHPRSTTAWALTWPLPALAPWASAQWEVPGAVRASKGPKAGARKNSSAGRKGEVVWAQISKWMNTIIIITIIIFNPGMLN